MSGERHQPAAPAARAPDRGRSRRAFRARGGGDPGARSRRGLAADTVAVVRPGPARLAQRRALVRAAGGHRRGDAGRGVGEVIASEPRRGPGRAARCSHTAIGWQDYAVIDPPNGAVRGGARVGAGPELMLSVAGMTGLTAYFGMLDIGRPVEGDTVLVTSAAGATGSIAGQIARSLGAGRVIGTAGAEEKRSWVRDVAGFDECRLPLRRRHPPAAPRGQPGGLQRRVRQRGWFLAGRRPVQHRRASSHRPLRIDLHRLSPQRPRSGCTTTSC